MKRLSGTRSRLETNFVCREQSSEDDVGKVAEESPNQQCGADSIAEKGLEKEYIPTLRDAACTGSRNQRNNEKQDELDCGDLQILHRNSDRK